MYFLLDNHNYYEIKCKKGNAQLKIVYTGGNITQYKVEHLLPYFEFIGLQWEPFNLQ